MITRQKYALILLLLYWPGIFILTHITVPLYMLRQLQASDKALHFLVYFVLILLVWYCVSSIDKPDWKKKNIWIVFGLLFIYAAADEWLQGLASGRTRDFADFLANLAGISCGLFLLSVFPFPPAVFIASAASIILFTNAVKIQFKGQLTFIRPLFLLSSFAFFTYFWNKFLSLYLSNRLAGFKYPLLSIALPFLFILFVKFLSQLTGRAFEPMDLLLSAAAVCAVTLTIFIAKKA